MSDVADLKSADGFLLYGFESRLWHFRSKSKRLGVNVKRLVVFAVVSAIGLAVSAATPWTGKKVAFLGDSITDPAQTNRSQRIYWQYLAEDLGLEPHVYAVSGYQWDRVYKAAQKMKGERGGDVDAILIFAGTNDYMNGIPLGEWYDVAEEEVYLKGKTLKLPRRSLAKTIAARLLTLPPYFKTP